MANKNVGSTQRRIHADQNQHAVIVHQHGRQPIPNVAGSNLNSSNVPNFGAKHVTNPLQRKAG